MKKRVLVFLLVFAFIAAFYCSWAVAAERKVKVTVLPFSIYSAEDLSSYERDIQEVLLSALAYHERVEPLDLDKLSKVIAGKLPSEMDENYAREVGRKMGADYVVLGSMTKVGETISLDARLVDPRSKKEPGRFYVETYGVATVLDRVGELAKKINESIFASDKIVKVTIVGLKRLTEEEVLGNIVSREGTLPYEKFLADDVKSITNMGYFEDVTVTTKKVEGGNEVIFSVKERPLVREVRVVGNDEISSKDLFEVITVKPPKVLSIKDVKNSLENVKDLYSKKQYYAATVDYKVEPISEDEVAVEFAISEGEKMMIKKITFIGNDKISGRTIEKGLANKHKGWFWWLSERGKFQKEELDTDVERVTAVYYDNGYLDAVVEPAVVEMKGDDIFITYKISEGKQYRIGTVDVSGDLIIAKELITKKLTVKSGDVFSRMNVITDIEGIVNEYNNEGYALVDVQPKTALDSEKMIVDIDYAIVKGKKTYFERINIGGNVKTLDKVIRRELKFAEGDLFNGDDLQRSREKVNNLGYFDEVNFAIERGSSDDKVVVNVEVKEKPTGLISAGLGYSSIAELTGMVRVQETNLFGRGYRVSIAAEFSSITTNYSGVIIDPYFLDTNLSVSLKVYNMTRAYDTYDAETMGFEIGFGYPIWSDTSLFVSYIFNDVNLFNISATADDDIKEYEGHTVTSGIEAAIVHDTRDNTFDPSSGSVNSLSVFYAGIGGDEYYVKAVAESNWYFPVVWKLVFHPRLEVGYIQPLTGKDLPIYARFFAGGLNSLRGFKPSSVGPKDSNGEYLGGNKELLVNLELIFPIFEDIKMKGVVFFDTGNVWGEDEDWNFGDLRYSIGAGIRWVSPLGPIRIEWGYNLDPRDDENQSEWNFSVGTSF
ncbi:MAG: outer membrane protein assembly factor BamA [Deltaproteobacteria bacterium]|nr:outer membrane protein assembly factor BamA [Candidatus Zymogenaceae bacterium]